MQCYHLFSRSSVTKNEKLYLSCRGTRHREYRNPRHGIVIAVYFSVFTPAGLPSINVNRNTNTCVYVIVRPIIVLSPVLSSCAYAVSTLSFIFHGQCRTWFKLRRIWICCIYIGCIAYETRIYFQTPCVLALAYAWAGPAFTAKSINISIYTWKINTSERERERNCKFTLQLRV